MDSSDRALVDRFLDMLAAEAGASPNTLAAYRNDLARAAEDLGADLESAKRDSLAKLGEKWSGLAASTVARRSSALRRFYRFLVDDGHSMLLTLPPRRSGKAVRYFFQRLTLWPTISSRAHRARPALRS